CRGQRAGPAAADAGVQPPLRGGGGAGRRCPPALGPGPQPGREVALLRSPNLPTATGSLPARARGVQPQITPGGDPSRGRGDDLMTADFPTWAKQGTFLS